MICPVCKGSKSIVTFNPLTWWDCFVCGGAGVLWLGIVKPFISIGGAAKKRKPKKSP